MSRAFVKEPDGDQAETDLPVRPQSKHPNYITMKGLEKQKAYLHELISECSALKISNTLADKNKQFAVSNSHTPLYGFTKKYLLSLSNEK